MRWSLVLSLLFSVVAMAAESAPPTAPAEPDFDSLGGNSILLERARALQPEKEVSIVQTRTVNRRHRWEFSPEAGTVMGGQTYTRTKSLGMNVDYHFNPYFSVGVKYTYDFNDLTREGNALVDAAYADYQAHPGHPTVPYPQLDYVKDEIFALADWYALYGKLNWFDREVVHFDIYTVGGIGQVRLNSGPASSYTAGLGVGLWLSQHFTSRFEMRYQTYTAQYYTGPKQLDLAVGSFQMGWLL
jgi:outer membrane beta-barrel protein